MSLKTTRYPSPRIGRGVRAGGGARRTPRAAGFGERWAEGHTLCGQRPRGSSWPSDAARTGLTGAARGEAASTPMDSAAERREHGNGDEGGCCEKAAQSGWVESRRESDGSLHRPGSASLTFRPAAPIRWIDTIAATAEVPLAAVRTGLRCAKAACGREGSHCGKSTLLAPIRVRLLAVPCGRSDNGDVSAIRLRPIDRRRGSASGQRFGLDRSRAARTPG